MVRQYRPVDLEDALKTMSEGNWIPFAGGTDLMIRARNWQGASRAMKGDVIFIQHLEALQQIIETEFHYRIGAGVTQAAFCECPFLPDYAKELVFQMATPAIRNAATIGGNVANAAQVADLLLLFVATDAIVVLKSTTGERTMSVEAFITGKYKTARKPEELIVEILLPKLNVERYLYKKAGQRRASILSKVSFLAIKEPKGTRLAIGAINEKVVRSRELEQQIEEGMTLEAVLSGYQALLHGEDDKRSTRRYREHVAINLIKTWMEAQG